MDYVDYALMLVGKPYIWGGNGAKGFDCSGTVIECLQAFDLLPNGDWTADSLSKLLPKKGWSKVSDFKRGDIVFWKNSTKYYHVAIMLNDNQYVEAGGGSSKCTTIENTTGMIRIRPLSWRKKPDLILRKV